MRIIAGTRQDADLASSTASTSVLVLAWVDFQARSEAIAEALDGTVYFVRRSARWMRWYLLPFRYLIDAIETWLVLTRRHPQTLVVISPPVFAPLMAWLWSRAYGAVIVIDCHTSAFDHRWFWTRPIHRWLARHVRALALHTDDALTVARGWSEDVFLLPDDVPIRAPGERGAPPRVRTSERPTIVVAGSLNSEEPVEETLRAAALLPACNFLLTGAVERVRRDVREAAPPNVTFTGWLPYPLFMDALEDADVVVTLSTGPHIVNRAAFEAIALGRALVLSDFPALRARFGDAAVFATNTPSQMAAAIEQALVQRAQLEEATRHVRETLSSARDAGLAQLRTFLA